MKFKDHQVELRMPGRLGCDAAHDVSKEFMKNYKGISPADGRLADDGVLQAIGTGDIVMSMKTPHGTKKGSRNLSSGVGRFTKDVGPVIFKSDGCFALKAKGLQWKLGAREGKGLFKLCMKPVSTDEANVTSASDDMGTPLRTSGTFDLGTLNIVVWTLSSNGTMVLELILHRYNSGSCAMVVRSANKRK